MEYRKEQIQVRLQKGEGWVLLTDGELFFIDMYGRKWRLQPTGEREIPLAIVLEEG